MVAGNVRNNVKLRAKLIRDFTYEDLGLPQDDESDIAYSVGTVGYVQDDAKHYDANFYPNNAPKNYHFGINHWQYEVMADIPQFKGWIMVIKKPPTEISPPKLSMHWAETWVNERQANHNAEFINKGYYDQLSDGTILDQTGYVPNEEKAVGIWYKKHQIRLFPHEYSIMTPERMRDYIFGIEGENIITHELVPRAEADSLMLQLAEDTDLRAVRESAIIDGCNEAQAYALLLGMDIEVASSDYPPVGWWRCKHEYAGIYCRDWEMEE
jgi:hypothetical protein